MILLLPPALDDAHGADFQAQRVAAQLRDQVELVHFGGGAEIFLKAQRTQVLAAAADLERPGQDAAVVFVAIPGEAGAVVEARVHFLAQEIDEGAGQDGHQVRNA